MKTLVNLPLFLSALEESEPHKHNFLLFSLSSPKYGTENPLIINCCFVLIGSHKRAGEQNYCGFLHIKKEMSVETAWHLPA
jgi:hypothetical protein